MYHISYKSPPIATLKWTNYDPLKYWSENLRSNHIFERWKSRLILAAWEVTTVLHVFVTLTWSDILMFMLLHILLSWCLLLLFFVWFNMLVNILAYFRRIDRPLGYQSWKSWNVSIWFLWLPECCCFLYRTKMYV